MIGETSDATYRFQLYSLVLFAYALVLKILSILSVVIYDCRGFEEFWIESGLLWAFVAVFASMTLFAALPWWQHRSRGIIEQRERRWALVATGFTLYVGTWLLLLFTFLHPDGLVGGALGARRLALR